MTVHLRAGTLMCMWRRATAKITKRRDPRVTRPARKKRHGELLWDVGIGAELGGDRMATRNPVPERNGIEDHKRPWQTAPLATDAALGVKDMRIVQGDGTASAARGLTAPTPC